MTSDYEYFAKVWAGQDIERPSTIWRRLNSTVEYLSVIDWEWHSIEGEVALPHPETLKPISAEHVATLLADRQRFVQYWLGYDSTGKPSLVYRRRQSPEWVADEVFGLNNEWIVTSTIKEFLYPGPDERPNLTEADSTTAEQVIEKARGISGATAL